MPNLCNVLFRLILLIVACVLPGCIKGEDSRRTSLAPQIQDSDLWFPQIPGATWIYNVPMEGNLHSMRVYMLIDAKEVATLFNVLSKGGLHQLTELANAFASSDETVEPVLVSFGAFSFRRNGGLLDTRVLAPKHQHIRLGFVRIDQSRDPPCIQFQDMHDLAVERKSGVFKVKLSETSSGFYGKHVLSTNNVPGKIEVKNFKFQDLWVSKMHSGKYFLYVKGIGHFGVYVNSTYAFGDFEGGKPEDPLKNKIFPELACWQHLVYYRFPKQNSQSVEFADARYIEVTHEGLKVK